MTNNPDVSHRYLADDYSQSDFRILIAEDDDVIRRILQMSLKRDGYQVDAVANGQQALDHFAENPSDLVVVDINMPGLDGYAVCDELRKHTDVPIIIVTTKSHTDDIVTGYQKGADIYLTKPFAPKELLARIRALLRRITHHQSQHDQEQVLSAGDIVLNDDTHEIMVRNTPVNLSPNEYDLLRYFLQHPNEAVSKETLLQAIWGYDTDEDANLVRVTVRRLRSKIEEVPSKPTYLQTVRGFGYKFVTTSASQAVTSRAEE